jgi:hypothetical protein
MSYFSSTRSLPRIHQPTVVRRPSGRKLGFLPAPAQLSPSASGSSFNLTPPSTESRHRYSMPAYSHGKGRDIVASHRSRKPSEPNAPLFAWGTFGASGDLFNSLTQQEVENTRERGPHRKPDTVSGDVGRLKGAETYKTRPEQSTAPPFHTAFDHLDQARKLQEAGHSPNVVPVQQHHSPQVPSHIVRKAPELGRIWSSPPHATDTTRIIQKPNKPPVQARPLDLIATRVRLTSSSPEARDTDTDFIEDHRPLPPPPLRSDRLDSCFSDDKATDSETPLRAECALDNDTSTLSSDLPNPDDTSRDTGESLMAEVRRMSDPPIECISTPVMDQPFHAMVRLPIIVSILKLL